MNTIKYPLVTTSFTQKECAYIMSPILTSGLHAIRLQKHLPQTLVYAPIKYQGIGLPNPWITQLIEHIHVFLRHICSQSLQGQLLRSNVQNLVLELGSGHPIWSLPYATWAPIIADGWLKLTWQDLRSVNLSLRGPSPVIPMTQVHDTFLMDTFMAHDATPLQLRSLNKVRMFKQVTRLSEIVTANGIFLDQTYLTASPPTRQRPCEWPRTTRPNPTALQLRKHFLRLSFLPPLSFSRRLV